MCLPVSWAANARAYSVSEKLALVQITCTWFRMDTQARTQATHQKSDLGTGGAPV